jgi:hypothetical protein
MLCGDCMVLCYVMCYVMRCYALCYVMPCLMLRIHKMLKNDRIRSQYYNVRIQQAQFERVQQ